MVSRRWFFIFCDSLGRIYPNPVKRLAPDFYFQPQVYRGDGQSIQLPPGSYTVTYTGGPEYVEDTRRFTVTDRMPSELTFRLNRWIDPERPAGIPAMTIFIPRAVPIMRTRPREFQTMIWDGRSGASI